MDLEACFCHLRSHGFHNENPSFPILEFFLQKVACKSQILQKQNPAEESDSPSFESLTFAATKGGCENEQGCMWLIGYALPTPVLWSPKDASFNNVQGPPSVKFCLVWTTLQTLNMCFPLKKKESIHSLNI